jgi:hypothetical protein
MENFPGSSGPASPAAREAVATPAILLMVTGGLGAVLGLVGLVRGGSATPLPPQFQEDPNLQQFGRVLEGMQSSSWFFNLLAIAISGFIIFGALKMKSLESYGLAFAAAILAAIPCISPCCCIGLPVGIWAAMVLNKPEVKASFR